MLRRLGLLVAAQALLAAAQNDTSTAAADVNTTAAADTATTTAAAAVNTTAAADTATTTAAASNDNATTTAADSGTTTAAGDSNATTQSGGGGTTTDAPSGSTAEVTTTTTSTTTLEPADKQVMADMTASETLPTGTTAAQLKNDTDYLAVKTEGYCEALKLADSSIDCSDVTILDIEVTSRRALGAFGHEVDFAAKSDNKRFLATTSYTVNTKIKVQLPASKTSSIETAVASTTFLNNVKSKTDAAIAAKTFTGLFASAKPTVAAPAASGVGTATFKANEDVTSYSADDYTTSAAADETSGAVSGACAPLLGTVLAVALATLF